MPTEITVKNFAYKDPETGKTLYTSGALSTLPKEAQDAYYAGSSINSLPPLPGEPAVLSTASAKRNFESKIQPKIDRANSYVTTAGERRTQTGPGTKYELAPDGKSYIPVEDLPLDVQDEIESGKTPEEKALEDKLARYDELAEKTTETYNNLTLAAAAAAKANIQVLTDQWKERRALLERSNKASEGNWMQLFIRYGQAEYSPGMTGDMITAKEEEGARKVKALDDQYNSAVASVNAALEQGDFERAAQLTSELDAIEEKAQKAIDENVKNTRAVNEKIREQQIKATRDTAIGGLVAQGITDPTELIDLLNLDEEGNMIGDFTAEEIDAALKRFTVEGLTAKDVSNDLATFEFIRDNYGLPDEIAALPPEQQYFAYIAAVKKANTAPKETSGGGGYTAQELRKLRQAGIDPSDIKTADDFLYGEDEEEGILSWEEYLEQAKKAAGVNYFMKADEAKLRAQYEEYAKNAKDQEPFTPTEKKKLEQAGLSNASRQEQLDYLFKKNEDEESTPWD